MKIWFGRDIMDYHYQGNKPEIIDEMIKIRRKRFIDVEELERELKGGLSE